jgi:hypothetical protein
MHHIIIHGKGQFNNFFNVVKNTTSPYRISHLSIIWFLCCNFFHSWLSTHDHDERAWSQLHTQGISTVPADSLTMLVNEQLAVMSPVMCFHLLLYAHDFTLHMIEWLMNEISFISMNSFFVFLWCVWFTKK